MKLSALAAQIKNCGHCEVINNGGRIFVGTGSAFYCMDGYPRTQDAGELGAMLGIPQKKMKNIFYHEEYTIDGKLYGVRWDDEPEHEGTTSEIKTRIVINGEELIALRNPDGSVGVHSVRTAETGGRRAEQGICADLCTPYQSGLPVYLCCEGRNDPSGIGRAYEYQR